MPARHGVTIQDLDKDLTELRGWYRLDKTYTGGTRWRSSTSRGGAPDRRRAELGPRRRRRVRPRRVDLRPRLRPDQRRQPHRLRPRRPRRGLRRRAVCRREADSGAIAAPRPSRAELTRRKERDEEAPLTIACSPLPSRPSALVAPAATARPTASQKNLVQTAVAAGQFKTLDEAREAGGSRRQLSEPGRTRSSPRPTPRSRRCRSRRSTPCRRQGRNCGPCCSTTSSPGGSRPRRCRGSVGQDAERQSVRIRVCGGKVFVNGAKVTKPNVMASNGVIHVINRVLIPPAS